LTYLRKKLSKLKKGVAAKGKDVVVVVVAAPQYTLSE